MKKAGLTGSLERDGKSQDKRNFYIDTYCVFLRHHVLEQKRKQKINLLYTKSHKTANYYLIIQLSLSESERGISFISIAKKNKTNIILFYSGVRSKHMCCGIPGFRSTFLYCIPLAMSLYAAVRTWSWHVGS